MALPARFNPAEQAGRRPYLTRVAVEIKFALEGKIG
jgi:hypothetical protein